MTTVISQQGDTVDIICHRFYGHTNGVIEAVLEANHGLADHGLTLPAGLKITLPAVKSKTNTQTTNLWDD